ncbi:MAG TPA: lipid-binding SYLF domain-containing protein [Gammaproteobacteria bacterium]|nr:lipid-binding SYLF domain-containing protein [Gammaproteobacteria bacterium]
MLRKTTLLILTAVGLAAALAARARAAESGEYERRFADAAAVLGEFTTDDEKSIPADLLARAQGIAVIPNVIRGGFILGGRRGRGVLAVRLENGQWSNPALITLTGGSIGWQFGAESADLVLVFANQRSVRHIADGKFTLGGDASAVAGPLGRRTTAALTGKAEVYAYFRSKGLFAGAAFEGARLDVDQQGGEAYYAGDPHARPLGPQEAGTPAGARRFLLALEKAASVPAPGARPASDEPAEGAVTFPLDRGQ